MLPSRSTSFLEFPGKACSAADSGSDTTASAKTPARGGQRRFSDQSPSAPEERQRTLCLVMAEFLRLISEAQSLSTDPVSLDNFSDATIQEGLQDLDHPSLDYLSQRTPGVKLLPDRQVRTDGTWCDEYRKLREEAEGRQNVSEFVYPSEVRYVFHQKLSPRRLPADAAAVTCPLCKMVLSFPLLLNCGHTVCFDCWDSRGYLDKCPVCLCPTAEPLPVAPTSKGICKELWNLLASLNIACDKCSWNGSYSNYWAHQIVCYGGQKRSAEPQSCCGLDPKWKELIALYRSARTCEALPFILKREKGLALQRQFSTLRRQDSFSPTHSVGVPFSPLPPTDDLLTLREGDMVEVVLSLPEWLCGFVRRDHTVAVGWFPKYCAFHLS